MTVVACRQGDVAPGECPGCGAAARPGGPTAEPGGIAYCSADCAADAAQRAADQKVTAHLTVRDYMCSCPDVCAPAGRPTRAEIAEYMAGRPR